MNKIGLIDIMSISMKDLLDKHNLPYDIYVETTDDILSIHDGTQSRKVESGGLVVAVG